MNISRFNNQKGVAHLFLLIVLLLGLGAGIYLVTQTQIFKPKASDPNANLSQGLVGYWKFDETTGTTVADSSGNNNTGTWKASTGTVTNQWVPGKFGNAGNFNGSTTFVSVNNNPSVAITGSLTIAGWVKRADPKKFSYGILTKGNVSSASNNAAYGLFLGATDQYALRVSNTGKTPINISTSKTYSNLDVWDHVVGVYTAPSSGVSAPVGAQGTLDIYINGQLAGKQVTNAPTSLFNNSAPVTIGSETADNGLPTWFWNGQLDEIRLYNRALSSSEVFQLYSYNPNPVASASPVSYLFGKAAKLDGTDSNPQYIKVPHSNSQNIQDASRNFTVEAWIKPDFVDGSGYIINKGRATVGDQAYSLTYTSRTNADGRVNYYYTFRVAGKRQNDTSCITPSASSNSGTIPGDNSQPVSKDKALSWRHVAAQVKDGRMSIYENGRLVAGRSDWIMTSFCNSTQPFQIGARMLSDGIPNEFFKGQIDEVRISDIARYPQDWVNAYKPFIKDYAARGIYHLDGNANDDSHDLKHGEVVGGVTFVDSTIVYPMDTYPTPNPSSSPSPSPSPSPSSSPVATSKRVFVTSTKYNGNLGGLSGADAKCQERANTANLGGTWKAWLSDSTTSVTSRFNVNFSSNIVFKLLNGDTIATEWIDLLDGSIARQISINEFNAPIIANAGQYPWVRTNTTIQGQVYSGSASCNNWTSSDGSKWGLIGNGYARDSKWTNDSLQNCGNLTHLYCFEQ